MNKNTRIQENKIGETYSFVIFLANSRNGAHN